VRLSAGARIGRYHILERIGSGGMGEVYRANDTRLEKTVAIKIIGSAFMDHPTAALRFERERNLTVALEHPHICRLLDAGQEDGMTYLAMEYLDGESLALRLSRGALPMKEALGRAIEMADALSYAHARGVIHRDLKPANVHLTGTGAKILDFGLAKLRPGDPAATLQGDTAPLLKTAPGTVIGSAMYMAPERLEGAEADERTDIFGFGLIVYEMVSGRRAFQAQSMASLIAAVMTADPPPLSLGEAHDELEWVIAKCLAKAPDERWQSMGDVAAVLRRLTTQRPTSPRAAPTRRQLVVAAVLGLALVGSAAMWERLVGADMPSRPPVAFNIEPPPDGAFSPTANSVPSPMLALSPDGSALAYVASGPDGVPQIWIRRFQTLSAHPLRGTEEAIFPFWSPNGQSLGFFSKGTLKRMNLAGGPARVLAATPEPCGGAWSASGVILFAGRTQGGLQRVSAEGGDVADATRLDSALEQTSHRWPRFIGDGSRFLYFARSRREQSEGIYLASLDAGAARLVARSTSAAEFLPPDRLLYLSDGSLIAYAFEPGSGRVSGEPLLVADRVASSSNFYAAFSVSKTGSLAYATEARASELMWFDRKGQRLSSPGTRGAFGDFRLSPDNRHLAVASTDLRSAHPDLYMLDLQRGIRERLTSTRVSEGSPIWSPDGLELIFRSNREAVHDLYVRPAFGAGPERVSLKSPTAKYPTSWSPDGTVLFHSPSDETGWDVWALAADRSVPARPVIRTRFDEVQGQLSPDGQRIAYTANEGSAFEVYVQPFAPGGRRWRVSMAGGSDPRWHPNGTELFYVAGDRWLMSVTVAKDMHPGNPLRLFRMPDVAVMQPYPSLYDVALDATRFLVRVPREDLRTLPLSVIVDWRARRPAASDTRVK
jgi:serine/threonine protein kinase